MGEATSQRPFVLLDDARAPAENPGGTPAENGAQQAADALYYEAPERVFSAIRPDDVAPALDQAQAALDLCAGGKQLAGYIAYEAGLALEPKLAGLAARRSGAGGPLVWLGLFGSPERIAAGDVPAWLSARAQGSASIGPLDPQVSPGGYVAAFERLREAIMAGDIYQANLTYPLAGSYRGDPVALYAGLRGSAAAGYGGIVFDGSHYLLSFSPELFVASDGGRLKAKPMKGTRPRAADPQVDRTLARELANSAKDRAENLMIVDLMRNDLARVAVPGSVGVDRPFAIESYPGVHQMVSGVRAELAPGRSATDLIRALFPCGSITGAPKIRAMELIAQAERDARGVYCGAIGRIGGSDTDGGVTAAFNVAIRTLRLTPGENGRGDAVLGVGSAIVADSEPLAERAECEVKADFVRRPRPAPLFDDTATNDPLASTRAGPTCDLIETMAFDPREGIVLLELHLARLARSAVELGFAFDRHAARNQIQALCFELETPARLRLLTAPGGAVALEAAPMPEPFAAPCDTAALPLPVDPTDWRLRHKTSDRGFYNDALAAARALGAFEAVLVRGDGYVTEGAISNVFLPESDDAESALLTPPAARGLLPGVLRAYLIEKGRAREADLTLDDLKGGFMLGNAVRGLFEARLT